MDQMKMAIIKLYHVMNLAGQSMMSCVKEHSGVGWHHAGHVRSNAYIVLYCKQHSTVHLHVHHLEATEIQTLTGKAQPHFGVSKAVENKVLENFNRIPGGDCLRKGHWLSSRTGHNDIHQWPYKG